MRDLLAADKPFSVLAWDGEKQVRAGASAPFKKPGKHHCYRLTMADGQWIEVADYHRILTDCGWTSVASLLPLFSLSLPRSIEECGRLVRGEDAAGWSEIPLDYRDGCSLDYRQCGEQPLSGSDTGQSCFPSQADALRHSLPLWRVGAHQPEHTNTGLIDICHPSSLDVHLGRAARSSGCLDPNAYTHVQLRSGSRQAFRQPSAELTFQPQSLIGFEASEHLKRQLSPLPVTPIAGNHIVSCEYISSLDVYDFEVFGWHNYTAGGLVHHNTFSGAAEMAAHLTGNYPGWWEGRTWDRAVRAWAGGKDSTSVRDSVARLLVGPSTARGTGMIPKAMIVDISPARGVPDGVDTVAVRHASGEVSELTFKSYDQGRERWQAASLDVVWLDEEPDEEIYTEALSRTNATGGMVYITFTPLLGMSNVVRRFLLEPSADRSDTNMTIHDAEHISAEQRQKIIDSYPAHEREARTMGVPILGSGRIFPVSESLIAIDAFPIPDHWPQIGGLDFGWDHPTAAVKIAWDRDANAVYVTHAYRRSEAVPAIHAAALKAWGAELPWAWPHDGLQHDKGSGEQLAQLYRQNGLKLMLERSQYEGERGNGVEAGLMDMLERMETARWFVFRHLNDWWEEFRLYHRKDGRVVKEHDDLMAASRYALMSLRFAKTIGKKPATPAKPKTFAPSSTGWMR
jgi:phage terminase large subunit-like protein